MLGLLLGFLWLLVLRLWLQANLFLNADTLSVPDIWASLRAGGHLGDWSMGNHAFIFPDLPLYQLAAWCSDDVAGRQLSYGLIQGFLAWWLGSRLAARLFYLKASEARACVAAGLMAWVAFLSAGSGLGQWLFPSHHGGAFLASLAMLHWVLGQRDAPSPWFKVFWVGALCGLVHASDAIFVLWVLVPAFCLSWALASKGRHRVWSAILLSFVVKAATQATFKAQGMKLVHFLWAYFFQNYPRLLGQAWHDSGAFVAAYAIPVGIAFIFALWLLSRWRSEPSPAALGLTWFVLMAGTCALGALQGQLGGRYLPWCLWVPFMLIPAALAGRWPRLNGWAIALPAAIGFFWLTLFRPSILPQQPEQRQAAWLDQALAQRGLRVGWADYWHARPLRLLSHQGAQLIPVITDWGALQPFEWISDRDIFKLDPDLEHPQFVVLNGLDQAKLLTRLKVPGELAEGEGLSVWFYPPHKHEEQP